MAAIDAISAPSPRPWRSRSVLRNVACSAVLAVMALFVFYPLALLLYGSFLIDADGGAGRQLGVDNWINAWQQPGMVQAIVNTVERVAATEVVALPAAVLIAWLVARTDLPAKRVIDGFFWVALFLPSLPVVLGWIMLFDPGDGLINKWVMSRLGWRQPLLDIYSFWEIVFVHLTTRSIAAKYIFLTPAFRNLDGSLEEASTIVGATPFATICRIVIPILMPAILITMAISLIHSLKLFEIELVLGPPTNFYVFSTKMYVLMQGNPPLFGAATVLGLSILIAIMPLIIWQQRLISTRSFVTVTSHFQRRLLRLRRLRWPLFAAIAALGLVITAIPTLCLIAGTLMNLFGHFELATVWTLTHWITVLADPVLLQSLDNTLILAGSAALIGVIWFSLVAYISVRTAYPGRRALDVMTWFPASLPGIILGLGLLWMFLTVPLFRPLYGTLFVLVVAVLINSVTTGVQLIKSNMIQVGYELEEASFVTGRRLGLHVPPHRPADFSVLSWSRWRC